MLVAQYVYSIVWSRCHHYILSPQKSQHESAWCWCHGADFASRVSVTFMMHAGQRFSAVSLSNGLFSTILHQHYSDVIMRAMVSQITSLAIVYSTVYWGADQRKRGTCFHLTTASCLSSFGFLGTNPKYNPWWNYMNINHENATSFEICYSTCSK